MAIRTMILRSIISAVALVCISVALQMGAAQQDGYSTPQTVQKILDSTYPAWKYPPPSEDWIAKYYRQMKSNPFVISGDFDGNGRQDYAVQLVHPDSSSSGMERIVAALLDTGVAFRLVVLEANAYTKGTIDILLGKMNQGDEGINVETDSAFTYPHDAISIGYADKGSVDYIWRRDRFEQVITGD